MSQTILLRRSSVSGNVPTESRKWETAPGSGIPSPPTLIPGEVGINTADGKMYITRGTAASGKGATLVEIGGGTSLPAQSSATNGNALVSDGSTSSWGNILAMIGTNPGQVTPANVLNALLPQQTVASVLVTDGVSHSWSPSIQGSIVSGPVALATNSSQLDGHAAADFATATHTHPDLGGNSKGVTAVINVPADITAIDAHRGALVRMQSATNSTYNVAADADTSPVIPVGSTITIRQNGAGQTTVLGASGVVLTSVGTTKTRAQHATVQLIKVGADEWDLVGDVEI